MPSSDSIACDWCGRRFPTKSARSQHVQRTPGCLRKREEAFQKLTSCPIRGRHRTTVADSDLPLATLEHEAVSADGMEKENEPPELEYQCSPSSTSPIQSFPSSSYHTHSSLGEPTPGLNNVDTNAEPPSRQARVDDVLDDRDQRFAEPFPAHKYAGATFGNTRTSFDAIRDDQVLHGAEILGPFQNDEEWALAKWLIKNVGHNAAEEFLKLAVVSTGFVSMDVDSGFHLTLCRNLKIQQAASVSFTSKDALYKRVDELPSGVNWHCREVVQEGDLMDANGKPLTERLELWYRDPVECVQELMGNPIFKNHLAYAPTRVYQDREGRVRQIDEMWTGNWWWDVQVSILV